MKLLIGIVLLLSGCSMFPNKVTEVYIPTYVPCVTHIAIKPVLTFKDEVRDIYYQVQALLIDRVEMQKYEADLEAIVSGCTQAP